jgi:hypothetical protein
MPRRYIDYPDAFALWNYVSSIGSYISAFGVLIFLYGVIEAFARSAWPVTIRGARAQRRWNGRCPRRRRSTSSRPAAHQVSPGSMHPWTARVAAVHRRRRPAHPARSTCGTMPISTPDEPHAKAARSRAARIEPNEALAFGLALSVGSVVAALGLAGQLDGRRLLAFTIFFYAVIYTMWLKRSTPQNIVIGGAAGAFPPMIGWAAVTGTIDLGQRRSVPRSSSCGRRRISGRWRCSRWATMKPPACRCCRITTIVRLGGDKLPGVN